MTGLYPCWIIFGHRCDRRCLERKGFPTSPPTRLWWRYTTPWRQPLEVACDWEDVSLRKQVRQIVWRCIPKRVYMGVYMDGFTRYGHCIYSIERGVGIPAMLQHHPNRVYINLFSSFFKQHQTFSNLRTHIEISIHQLHQILE